MAALRANRNHAESTYGDKKKRNGAHVSKRQWPRTWVVIVIALRAGRNHAEGTCGDKKKTSEQNIARISKRHLPPKGGDRNRAAHRPLPRRAHV